MTSNSILLSNKKKEEVSELNLADKSKIVFIGPPEAGKTTIKEAFFGTLNPLQLLQNPLEPTYGVEIDNYLIFQSKLGIFDLSGQENDSWLSFNSNIFEHTDIIMNIFDARHPISKIVDFMDKIIKIRKEKCKNASLYIILHKFDLIPRLKIYKKMKLLSNYIKVKHNPQSSKISVPILLQTSIVRENFLNSYQKFEKIFRDAFNKKICDISNDQYEDLSLFIKILMNYKFGIKYNVSDLLFKFKISKESAKKKILYMQYLNLVKIYQEQYSQKFSLTERADYISSKISTLQNNIAENFSPKSGKQFTRKAKLDFTKLETIIDTQESEKNPIKQKKEKSKTIQRNSTESFINFLINIRKEEL